MIDIKFLRNNPEAVRENICKKYQEEKLPLVDQVLELDELSLFIYAVSLVTVG